VKKLIKEFKMTDDYFKSEPETDGDNLLNYIFDVFSGIIYKPNSDDIDHVYFNIIAKYISEDGLTNRSILDFGCGDFRLPRALRKENIHFKYMGTDIKAPTINGESYSWPFVETSNVTSSPIGYYDYGIMVNVLHELSVLEFANSIEFLRSHLHDNGKLIIVEKSILSHGEPLAIPLYPQEIGSLFAQVEDLSYHDDHNQIVSVIIVDKEDIAPYIFNDIIIRLMLRKKLLTLASIVYKLTHKRDEAISQLENIGLGDDMVFDYGYLSILAGNVFFRLEEYKTEDIRIFHKIIDRMAIVKDIFKCIKAQIERNPEIRIRLNDLFETVSKKHNYEYIKSALEMLERCNIIETSNILFSYNCAHKLQPFPFNVKRGDMFKNPILKLTQQYDRLSKAVKDDFCLVDVTVLEDMDHAEWIYKNAKYVK
jgi:hypothetical protein